MASKLVGQSWENKTEVASVHDVARSEETSAEHSQCEHSAGDALCDSCLPCAGHTVQPISADGMRIFDPVFNTLQYPSTRTIQTLFSIPDGRILRIIRPLQLV
jgi:hypothetical protein